MSLRPIDPDNIALASDTQNAADVGVYSAPEGAWAVELPLENLKDPQVTLKARTETVDPALTHFTIDFGKRKVIRLLALIGHNLSPSASWRVILSNSDTFNPVLHDTGPVKAWPKVERFGALPWGQFRWGGVLGSEVAEEYTINSYIFLPRDRSFRYCKVYLINSANTNLFLEAGRFYAGPIYQPSYNFLYGAEIGWEDPSVISYSRGGQRYVDERPSRRVFKFRLSRLPEGEAMGQIFDQLDRRVGIKGNLIVIPQPSKPSEYHRQAFYGAQRTVNPHVAEFDDAWGHDFVIEENL